MNRCSIKGNQKLFWITCLLVISTTICYSQQNSAKESKNEFNVAAYIWPSCHNEAWSKELLWPEGIGEWEIIKKGTPRFEGHHQPKIPLWGYEMDDNPRVMEKWIEAATDHGVNIFIFDWYWYDGRDFLENSINNGFLKAKNNEKMKFYIMWANHDVRKNYWNVYKYKDDTSLLWNGGVDFKNFKIIVDRAINQYFKKPNYFKIDNKPVFSIFSLNKFIEGMGGLEKAREAIDYFNSETKSAGFPGLHIQLTVGGLPNPDLLKKIESLDVSSITQYNWGGPIPEDYIQWGAEAGERMNEWSSALSIPYFPNVSIGFDDTPRFPHYGKENVVHLNKSPESFAAFLQKAKGFCNARPEQPKLITIFSWNEWVEGSYLLPDIQYGFSYLKKLKEVMDGEYDVYSE